MELSLKRIQKIAQVMKVLTNVIFIISIVGAVLILAGTVTYRFFGASTLAFNNIEIHGLLEITDGKSSNLITSEMVSAFLECLVSVILFKKANIYFIHELEAGTPFTDKGADEIKKLGIYCCAFTVGASIISAIVSVILKTDVEFNGEAPIVTGVILIFLSFIFSYGSELEKNKKD